MICLGCTKAEMSAFQAISMKWCKGSFIVSNEMKHFVSLNFVAKSVCR